MELNDYVAKCHENAKNKGFWDIRQSVGTLLMLIVSELGEALEADRKGDKDNFAEELADTFIRLCDMCGGLGIDLESAVHEKMTKNQGRPKLHGKKY